MYCRKCGAKINDSAKFCDFCGEKVMKIKERCYAEKYKEQKILEKNKNQSYTDLKKEQKHQELKNPYVIPAMMCACLAFGLGIFPWPASWKIGTSLWMSIVILIISLLSAYHCVKAKQVNRLYDMQYHYQIKPHILKTATLLSTITIMADLFVFVSLI